jgi:hypothetical protein
MLTKLRQIGNRSIKSSTAPLLYGWRSGRRWLDGEKHQANQVMILGYHQVVSDIIRAEGEAIFGMVNSDLSPANGIAARTLHGLIARPSRRRVKWRG